MQTAQTIAVLSPETDLDVRTAAAFRSQLDTLITGGCRRIIINMSQVSYIDSTAISMLLTELRKMRELGGLLSLSCVSDEVFYTLKLMRLVDHIPISQAGVKPILELDESALPLSSISFATNVDELSEARTALESYLSDKELEGDLVFDLKLAAGEALGNAFDHACASHVTLTAQLFSDRVVLDIVDDGCGFEIEDDEDCPCVLPTDERGRGIRLMRLLMDSVSIHKRTQAAGTEVKLVKLIRM